MKAQPIPSRLDPLLVRRIWGRLWLDPLYTANQELAEPVGEVWLTGEDCRFADGPYAGKPLGQAWQEMSGDWKGSRLKGADSFPLLAKFLFPDLALSIQVHPDDEYAARHEAEAGGLGKTEMWYAVAAEAGAEVLVGFNPGVDKKTVRRSIVDDTIESCLQRLPVTAGDTIYVPAGTAHAIGPGQIFCEIQEYSDLTYRLFDYHRTDAKGNRRELHVEKALDVIRFDVPGAGKTQPLVQNVGPIELSYLAACPYFATERWRFLEPIELASSEDHFDLLIFLAGRGEIVVGGDRREFQHGEAWFVPAKFPGFRLEPATDVTVLRAYVPDIDTLARSLLREGATRDQLSGFLFR
ncbi:MAG: class I mannose-6-phosphate isomerase [Acidobacteriota bacterium]|nr:class I mannose-6-phosphate isomerase [Acidobacteriota bacterium]